jgi:hypothetical protein
MSDVKTPATAPKKRNTLAIVLGFWLLIALIGVAFLGHLSLSLVKNNMQLRLQIAKLQASVLTKPQMPLTMGFGATMAGNGLAFYLHNTSTKLLRLRVTFTDPAREKDRVFNNVVLGPLATQQIDTNSAWAIGIGDRIEIEDTNHAPLVRLVTAADTFP